MNDELKKWSEKQDWDNQPLPYQHRDDFINRLNRTIENHTPEVSQPPQKTTRAIRLPKWVVVAIAAGLTLLIGMPWLLNSQNDLHRISPELAHSQELFNNTIASELQQLEAMSSPETIRVVAATKSQLAKLEDNYKQLEKDLQLSGYNKQIITAMIQNFKSRITILENAMQHLETYKELKKLPNEII